MREDRESDEIGERCLHPEEDSTVTIQQPAYDKTQVSLALESSIYIGLAILLAAACLLILLPFIPLLTWGIIIAVATYPGFRKLQKVLGGRETLAAVVCTLILLAVLIIPAILLGEGLAGGIQTVTAHLKEGSVIVPPPPPRIESWPVIGAPLKSLWSLASVDLTKAFRMFAPQIKTVLPGLLAASAGIGLMVLQLLLSILVAGILLANARAAHEVTSSLASRLFGEKGPEFQQLIGATIRSVTFGILGVALIQSAFAAVGFLVVGMPAVGLWTVIFIFAAVVQAGILVLIPAVIYGFATASVTKAVIFLVWCIFVGLMDNILKPILLGRGVAVPVAVVFLGAIGGFVAMGVIGLFVGAIVLSVGYKLSLAWLRGTAVANQKT
jgi:predicted PurR-regulated permease PerM